nr:copper resistance protein NlpE N-terminal domain-containing protein [uncultured Desulfobacter sp.]
MKTTLLASILAVLLLCSLGCAPATQKTQSNAGTATAVQNTADNHSSRDSLDWYGTYNGVLPCADCQGIQTRITLRKDNTFTKAVKYLGKDSRSRFSQGTIQWDDQGSTITLAESRGKTGRYKVGENILFHLDRNGNMIAGDSAQKYQLMKNAVDPDIENITWVLVELNGAKISMEKTPHLTFNSDNASVTGNDGCNAFNAAYTLKPNQRIDIDDTAMISTLMACDNMETAAQFIKAVLKADNYTVADGTFSLNKARMAPLAKFKKAQEQL